MGLPTFQRQRIECNISIMKNFPGMRTRFENQSDMFRRSEYIMRYDMNSKEIRNIRKQKWQTNGKTDRMGTRKILDDTMTNGHGKWTSKVGNEKLLEEFIEISEM
jgi:hypothetical protein